MCECFSIDTPQPSHLPPISSQGWEGGETFSGNSNNSYFWSRNRNSQHAQCVILSSKLHRDQHPIESVKSLFSETNKRKNL